MQTCTPTRNIFALLYCLSDKERHQTQAKREI